MRIEFSNFDVTNDIFYTFIVIIGKTQLLQYNKKYFYDFISITKQAYSLVTIREIN